LRIVSEDGGKKVDFCKVGNIIHRTRKVKIFILVFWCLFLKMEGSRALVVRIFLVALAAPRLSTAAPMNICKYQTSRSYKSPFVIGPIRNEFISLPQYMIDFEKKLQNLRNSIIRFVTSVCLSQWYDSASTERIFMKFGILVFCKNL
jgi:hypothetical protein